jgi:DNA-directed RNA polymerase subunit RPC12/RpoP
MTDVTDQVSFGSVDDEALPLHRCICGREFGSWEEILSIYPDHPWQCPHCGARLVFTNSIRVYRCE